MHRKLGFAVSVVVICLSAARTYAQRAPDTATMDRGDGITRLGVDFGLALLDKPPYDATLRIEPYGQYVARSGFGVYGAFPLARSFGSDADPAPQEATGIGDLELGGLLVRSTAERSWVFRLGVALPTASDDLDGATTNQLATVARLTDLALTVPDALYIRLSVTPLLHVHRFYLQLDLGADLGFETRDTVDAPNFLRANVGGGIDFGALALGLELVNLATLDNIDNNEVYVHALTLTSRFMGHSLQPVIAIGTPLDDSARQTVNAYVAVGIQYAFHPE